MIKFAVGLGAPVAVRYPKGEAYDGLEEFRSPIEAGNAEMIYEESEIALFALGSMVETAEQVRMRLKAGGHSVTLVNARFAAPLDEACICRLAQTHRLIVTMEENVASGGMGEHIAALLSRGQSQARLLTVALPDCFVEHGSINKLKEVLKIDADSVVSSICAVLDRNEVTGR